MMTRKGMIGIGLFLLLGATACGLSTAGGPSDTGTGDSSTPAPDEAPMVPVSINEGLASLDSYRLTYTNDVFDSVTQERNVVTLVVASDRAADASYNRTETVVTTADDEVLSEDVQEQYVIGHQVCAISAGEAEVTTISDAARVMSDLMSQAVEFNPVIENPVYVGEDVVNGVPVRTYTFELRSLGAASDVEVARADGTYAVAADGDYLVHYRLDLELRSGTEEDPAAEVSVSSFEVTLEEINQPVDIVFPESCPAPEPAGE